MGCDGLRSLGGTVVGHSRTGLRFRVVRPLRERLRDRRDARPPGDRSLSRDARVPRAVRSRQVPRLVEGVRKRVPLDTALHCGRRIRHF